MSSRSPASRQKTNAYQENRNLLLSKTAHADSIPGLEILANDVRCTHGATLSQVDLEPVREALGQALEARIPQPSPAGFALAADRGEVPSDRREPAIEYRRIGVMKAAVLCEVGKPLTIEDVQIDDPRSHEVLIRTAAVGVCHSDLHYIDGLYSTPMPTVLGHEAAGVVEKVGSEVRYVNEATT